MESATKISSKLIFDPTPSSGEKQGRSSRSKSNSVTANECDWDIADMKADQEASKEQCSPTKVNNEKRAYITGETYNESSKKWNNTIAMYVFGTRPYYVHLKGYINRVWKPKGEFEIFSRPNGYFFVKFSLEEDCERILSGGPYFFDSRLIIPQKWKPGLKFTQHLLTTLPVWVRFPYLDLVLWSVETISRIASVLGIPIKMDDHTANRTRLKYARVLIEMEATSEFAKEVNILMFNGEKRIVPVEYEYLPPRCLVCKVFGHVQNQCKEKRNENQMSETQQIDEASKKNEVNMKNIKLQEIGHVGEEEGMVTHIEKQVDERYKKIGMHVKSEPYTIGTRRDEILLGYRAESEKKQDKLENALSKLDTESDLDSEEERELIAYMGSLIIEDKHDNEFFAVGKVSNPSMKRYVVVNPAYLEQMEKSTSLANKKKKGIKLGENPAYLKQMEELASLINKKKRGFKVGRSKKKLRRFYFLRW